MFEVNDIPPIDSGALQDLIAENVRHEEFLFFRFYAGDEQDYFGPDSYTKRYECFCTACRERFTEPHSAGPASKWRMCPRCGRSVTPKRWAANDHAAALRKVSFAFHFFQVGPHGELWLTSCQVRMYPYFLLEKYTAFEYCRYVFSAAGAKKWSWQYDGWALRKNCTFRHWYDMGGGRRDDFWVLPSEQELAASALRYSQLTEAFAVLHDLTGYLALYCKYPAVEYLWKMGFGCWLREREQGGGDYFSRLVNLRAKEPKKLFRGLGKADVRLLREKQPPVSAAAEYKRLKTAGVVRADDTGIWFAASASTVRFDTLFLADRCGVTAPELRKYMEKQARRSAQLLPTLMQELMDYHDQLARMQIGGEKLPHDLHEAHARLSERERRLMNREKNEKFRTRRHLLAWMRWKYKGMFIRPIDSAEEIVREGEEQNNCVAGYADRHADGKTIIMVLRKCSEPRKPWHTVEIDPKTLVCRQCYAAYNHERTPEAAEFMDKYLDHLREVTKMIRRSA